MIKVGSDFSGVGAFDQALIRLGIDYKTVFACDMDKYARQTYIHNYGEPKYFPKDVYDRAIPEDPLDIYMTSPPCQAFSLAGKRLGEDDERGILFYNSHEFIQKNKPRFFIFENVKGLLSDDAGKTFRAWVEFLGGKSINGNPVIFPHTESVPYHIYYTVLNAKDYGIPQNRERVFIVGIRDDSDNFFTWPRKQFLEKRLKDVLENDVDEKYYLSDKMIEGLIKHKERHEEKGTGFKWEPRDLNGTASCLRANAALAPTDNTIKVKSATSKGFEINEQTLTTSCNQGVTEVKFNFNNNDTRKILLKLQQEIGTKEIESWGLRILETIQQKEVLRQELHERRIFKKEKERSERNNEKIQQGESAGTITNVLMRSLPKETWEGCSPQRRESIKQLIRELNESLQVVSHENPQTESNLQSGELQNESEGIRILREALSTIQEIWQSFSYENEERPSSFRIRKLTPREAFRLMDFPESFTWPVSDSQAYKQAGNSICVGVLAGIISKLNIKK